MGKVFERAL